MPVRILPGSPGELGLASPDAAGAGIASRWSHDGTHLFIVGERHPFPARPRDCHISDYTQQAAILTVRAPIGTLISVELCPDVLIDRICGIAILPSDQETVSVKGSTVRISNGSGSIRVCAGQKSKVILDGNYDTVDLSRCVNSSIELNLTRPALRVTGDAVDGSQIEIKGIHPLTEIAIAKDHTSKVIPNADSIGREQGGRSIRR